MHPVIHFLGYSFSSYTLINHILGLLIPGALYLVFLRQYSRKRGIEINWFRLITGLVVIIITGRYFARGIFELMYTGNLGSLSGYRLGEGSIMFGGFLGVAVSVGLITHLRKRNTLFWLDVTSIWLAFAIGIRKIGCFLTGCCRGTETVLPWGVVFPGSTVPVHPLQLYESIFGFAMAVYLWRRFMRRDMPAGSGFFLFFSLFSLLRLVTLPIREIPANANFVALGPIAFLVLAVAAGAVYLRLTKGCVRRDQ
jgi:phosphatidylglycerol:prolipoprotein diacylglycerol transferase